jgi:hypothetical protein
MEGNDNYESSGAAVRAVVGCPSRDAPPTNPKFREQGPLLGSTMLRRQREMRAVETNKFYVQCA